MHEIKQKLLQKNGILYILHLFIYLLYNNFFAFIHFVS